MKAIGLWPALAAPVLLGGCGTLSTLRSHGPTDALVYSGVRDNCKGLGEIAAGEFWWSDPLVAAMLVADLPLSLVGDTVALPYTLLRDIAVSRPLPDDGPEPPAPSTSAPAQPVTDR